MSRHVGGAKAKRSRPTSVRHLFPHNLALVIDRNSYTPMMLNGLKTKSNSKSKSGLGYPKEEEGQVQDQNQVYVQVQVRVQDRETLLGGGMIDLPS